MRQVIDLAAIYRWQFVHFRPAQTTRGWRTPVQGPLGKGWPDLVMFRGLRSLAIELKSEAGKVTPEQLEVLHVLDEAGFAQLVGPGWYQRGRVTVEVTF